MIKFTRIAVWIIFIFLSGLVQADSHSLVKVEKVQESIKALEANKLTAEEDKQSLLKLYNKILDVLEKIQASQQLYRQYKQETQDAPGDIERLTNSLDKMQQEVAKKGVSDQEIKKLLNLPLNEIEHLFNIESTNLSAASVKKIDLEQQLASETNNSTEIQKQLVDSNHELDELKENKGVMSPEQSDELKQASRWLQESQTEMLRSRIKMLDKKLSSQPVRVKLLKLKKSVANYEYKQIQAKVQQLEELVDQKRQSDVKKTKDKVLSEQHKVQGKHEVVQALAKKNTELSERISQKTAQLDQIEEQAKKVIKETQRIKEQQIITKKKLEIAGLSQILGQVLLEEKKALPDRTYYKQNLKKREKAIAKAGMEQILYQDDLNRLEQKDEYLAKLMKNIEPEAQSHIRDDLEQLLKTRVILLHKAMDIDAKHLKAVTDLDYSEKILIQEANKYADLLEQHLFWLRSASLLKPGNFSDIPEQLQFILSPASWFNFIQDLLIISLSSPILFSVLTLGIVLLGLRRTIHNRVVESGLKTKKISADNLFHTWKAILLTLLLALPLPLMLLALGQQLKALTEVSSFSNSVGHGILIIVLPLFSLLAFRSLCLSGGVFEVHFKWSQEMIFGLKKEMGRLMLTFLPIIFITAFLISNGTSDMNGGLGRLFLLFTLATFALFFFRLLNTNNGLLSSAVKKEPDMFFARYQKFILVFMLALVLALMVLTVLGYVYTAGQLTTRLIYSVWLVFAMVVLQQMSVRWLLIAKRKYALQLAIEKRQAVQKEKQQAEGEPAAKSKKETIDFEEPEIDMVSLSEDSKYLMNIVIFISAITGLFFIWSDVFPAFGWFEKIELWHIEGVVNGSKQLVPVTLWDMGLALMLLVITMVGAKRLPAIIEIFLLNTSVSKGNRYTITTLMNYSIIGIGLFTVVNILGADWARFQWLFAALGVGIGFGLQEIVANFISGLIILFERPIRVGDMVSVGGTSGVVTKIRIRATTILTFDRKELLVPNKEFITTQLLNWTYSDQSTRLSLPIGVAYGSDIPKAKSLLLEAANEHDIVLMDPLPQVIFIDFGDNTLNLELRCFIENIDNRLTVISELNEAINNKFNEAGINIAFPQRDVHLDISQPIEVNLQSAITKRV